MSVSSLTLPFLLGETPVAFTQAECSFQLNLFHLGPSRLSVPATLSPSETVHPSASQVDHHPARAEAGRRKARSTNTKAVGDSEL